jgi:thiamine-phosphate pyrophosphorylase
MQELCRQHNALFIVNDRVDIALAMGADGVHLGQQDMPVSVARRLLGAETIIGVSVSSETEAVLAAEAGASYLGVGHIFRTVSKQKTTPPIGLESVRPVCLASALPVIAIGGIDLTNAAGVIDAGATGIAVISAVSGSSDPETATRKFMNIIRQR